MEIINGIAAFLSKIVQWWFTVMPWEQAIRIRRGNKVKVFDAGLYFKIPFIDVVYKQTTRMRMIEIPIQTITTKDGQAITVKSCVGYSINNILVLYKSLYHPEATLNSLVMGMVSECIRTSLLADISPNAIEGKVNQSISAGDYGLKEIQVRITTFAVVKTFRLIQDSSYQYNELPMDALK